MEKLDRKERNLLFMLASIFLILSAGIVTAGYFYYQHYKTNYRTEVENQLSAIGKLKADELEDWREGQLQTGRIFYKNESFSRLVEKYFDDPNDERRRERIRQLLSQIQANSQYDELSLLDSKYTKMITAPAGGEGQISYISEDNLKLVQSGKMVFEDFYRNSLNQRIYLKVLVPILDEEDGGRIISILSMRIDPETYLYPYLRKWPIPDMTAETLLVRREGDEVVYLNDLRFRKDAALVLRRPLKDNYVASVKATLGHEGIVEGIDYRNEPVIADVRAVQNSPWFLITRMDTAEVYGPIQSKIWITVLFISVLLGGVFAAFMLIWRQQRLGFYRAKYESAKEWSATFDSITDLITVMSPDFELKKVNKSFADALGKRPEELIGRHCYELVHNTKQPPADCPCRKTLLNKEPACVEIFHEGLQKHLEISTSPVLNNEEEIIEIVHSIRDISERKRGEKALQKSEAMYRALVETTGTGFVIIDRQGNVLEANPEYVRLTGHRNIDEIRGRNVIEWTAAYEKEKNASAVRECFKKGNVRNLEIDYVDTVGKITPIEINATVVETGGTTQILTLCRDITERKRAQEELRRSNEALKTAIIHAKEMAYQAEQANKAKSEFLANMSHEIRTPMNAIIGFSDLLAEEEISREHKQYVEMIKECGHNLLGIISDILDFSKIQAGKLDVEMTDCHLGKLLSSIGLMISPKIKEKGLKFSIIMGDNLPVNIHTDTTRLNQCLLNLLSNAVKFTKEGHVYVKVSLENTRQEPYIRFDVEDTGIGISKDKQQLIFEPFTQADGSTTRLYGGTGLGLTITKQMAELMNGELCLESEPGKGSTFSLLIPAGVEVTRGAILKSKDMNSHLSDGSEKIDKVRFTGCVLVAEDNKTNQRLIKSQLERMGLEVTLAEDGNSVMQKALAKNFDVIFMDMHLPNINGYEATRLLRNAGLRTPIVAVTASAMQGSDKNCLAAGCDDFLCKPIIRQALVKVLTKYLTCEMSV